jgi:hypothetical protein
MDYADVAPQKAVILWLSGMSLSTISTLPAVQELLKQGVTLELHPSPITGRQAQRYAAFSGNTPSSFGFFDELVPRNYAVVEEATGRGPTPPLLPDVLRSVGWSVRYEQLGPAELAAHIQDWTQSAPGSPSCLILECAGEVLPADLTRAVTLAREWAGKDGLLALLSETRPASVKRFVNVNNFLADMGVIERDQPGGQVSWPDSLAFYAGNGQLWINLMGREAHGTVHPQDEYEEVRETLIKAMPAKLRDPETGEPVIERVYRKEELYAGDYLFCAPDLVVVFQPGYAPSPRSARLEFDETAFTRPPAGHMALAGAHPSLLRGFLLAAAPSLRASFQGAESEPLTAVVPTLCHALGIEYVGMEHPAVSALFTSSYLEHHPVPTGAQNRELSEEDEELIISHLRDLGYV